MVLYLYHNYILCSLSATPGNCDLHYKNEYTDITQQSYYTSIV